MTQDHAIPIETFERIEAERRTMRASRRNPQTHPSERSFRPSMGQIRILAAIALFRVDAGTQGVQSITKSNGELVEDAALYYDEGMTHRFSRPIAWLLLLFIVFATVSPIGDRPHDFLPVQVDRALAFAIMTAFFLIAYPTRLLLVSALCLASAFGIEALQFLSPTRDPHLSDASVKAIGALIGIGLGLVANACRKWIRRYPP